MQDYVSITTVNGNRWFGQWRPNKRNIVGPQPSFQRVTLLAAILLGYALRLYRLGSESLWYDESISVFLAKKPIHELVEHTARDIHPPGYYLLLHGWHIIVQPTLEHGLEFLYSWPSAAFGVLVIVLLWPIGIRLFSHKLAIFAVYLAAINPYQIWYSQEVRMYTMGAVAGLICVWAVLNFFESAKKIPQLPQLRQTLLNDKHSVIWLLVYTVSALLGIYTLYYFLFLWIGINLFVFSIFWYNHRHNLLAIVRPIMYWIVSQFGILLGFSFWLRVFLRQAIDPPVPVWRQSWRTPSELLGAIMQGMEALLYGQSTERMGWLSICMFGLLVLLVFCHYTKFVRAFTILTGITVVTCTCIVPIVLIYLISIFITPIYHVRYLLVFAPMFMYILALGIASAYASSSIVGVSVTLLIVAGSGFSLHEYWFSPNYRTDDHRSAVANLAYEWRPGDAILVNAGWVYPVLEIYWPYEITDPDSARPPQLQYVSRLSDWSTEQQPLAINPELPTTHPGLIRTGSVDGTPGLGWGDPESDFFAMTAATTQQALQTVSLYHPRIWHYRLYDTVSDPTGQIRAWLANNMQRIKSHSYSGRDFLLVELYRSKTERNNTTSQQEKPLISEQITFENALLLHGHEMPRKERAGEILYVTLQWEALKDIKRLDSPLSMSLRIYNETGALVSKQDSSPDISSNEWEVGKIYYQSLAVPLPVSINSATYSVGLVVYRQTDTTALTVPDSERTILGQIWKLGSIQVQTPQ